MLHLAWLSYRWMLGCEVVHGTICMRPVVIPDHYTSFVLAPSLGLEVVDSPGTV